MSHKVKILHKEKQCERKFRFGGETILSAVNSQYLFRESSSFPLLQDQVRARTVVLCLQRWSPFLVQIQQVLSSFNYPLWLILSTSSSIPSSSSKWSSPIRCARSNMSSSAVVLCSHSSIICIIITHSSTARYMF